MRNRKDAIAWGRRQVDAPVKDFTRLCLQFVRMAFDLPAIYPDAGTAWDRAERKHPTTNAKDIPAGVPVFWELPSVADHIALSIGNGLCLSNDVKRSGRIDIVRIDAIGPAWGGRLLGWTEDVNGYTVYNAKPVAPKPPKAPVRNKVERARDALRLARRNLAIAERELEDVSDARTVVKRVAGQLDELDAQVTAFLRKLPPR